MKGMWIGAVAVALAALLAVSAGPAGAEEMGHGSMPGMHGEGHAGGHGEMMKGDKIFGGKVGPWTAEARLVDMKAEMQKAMASGMKMEGPMKTHHVELYLTDSASKKAVEAAKGTITVTGPDKKSATTDLMAMAGHLGADVDLAKPGKYSFKVAVESGGKKGTASFSHTVK